MVGNLITEGEEHNPARMPDEERHVLCGQVLRGDDEISFVLPVFIIHNDDHLSLAEIFQCGGDGGEGHSEASRRVGA